MLTIRYHAIKALIAGVLIAAVSEIAYLSPGFGALVASLPLVSVLGMIWLWRDTHDPARMAAHAGATFWFVLPSLPMFLLIPAMLSRGAPFRSEEHTSELQSLMRISYAVFYLKKNNTIPNKESPHSRANQPNKN